MGRWAKSIGRVRAGCQCWLCVRNRSRSGAKVLPQETLPGQQRRPLLMQPDATSPVTVPSCSQTFGSAIDWFPFPLFHQLPSPRSGDKQFCRQRRDSHAHEITLQRNNCGIAADCLLSVSVGPQPRLRRNFGPTDARFRCADGTAKKPASQSSPRGNRQIG